MGRCRLVLLSLVVVASASAQPRIGREQTLHRQTQAGQPVRVFTYTQFDRVCRPLPAPQVVIKSPPQHGRVSTTPAEIEVRVVREGMPDCSGRVMPGTAVFYDPAPAFRGTDQFDYDVLVEGTPRHDTAVIDVR